METGEGGRVKRSWSGGRRYGAGLRDRDFGPVDLYVKAKM